MHFQDKDQLVPVNVLLVNSRTTFDVFGSGLVTSPSKTKWLEPFELLTFSVETKLRFLSDADFFSSRNWRIWAYKLSDSLSRLAISVFTILPFFRAGAHFDAFVTLLASKEDILDLSGGPELLWDFEAVQRCDFAVDDFDKELVTFVVWRELKQNKWNKVSIRLIVL